MRFREKKFFSLPVQGRLEKLLVYGILANVIRILWKLTFLENKTACSLFVAAENREDILLRLSMLTEVPLEIKSGKDYAKHAALNHVLEHEAYQISKAYVFHNGNVSRKGKVMYAPIYMLMFIKKEQKLENPIYKLDLSVLK